MSLQLEVMVTAGEGMGAGCFVALTAEEHRVVSASLLSRYLSLEFWSASRSPSPQGHPQEVEGRHQQVPQGLQKYVWTLFRRRNLWVHTANDELVLCAVARRPTLRRA